MAKSVKINEVTYKNVPKIEVPLSEGTGNAEFWDTTGATGTAENVLVGKTVFGAAGVLTGTMPDNGAQTEKITKVADAVKIAKGYHNGTGTVAIDAAEQEKIKSPPWLIPPMPMLLRKTSSRDKLRMWEGRS